MNMTRKELEELGLEKDVIDKVMDLNGQAINKTKAELEEAKTTAETLQTELDKRVNDFNELKGKSKNTEELQERLETLNDEYDKFKEETTQREKDIKLQSALKLAIAKSGTIDEVSLKANLDLEEVELLEDGTLKGIDAQIEALKEDKEYLFKKQLASGIKHGGKAKDKTDEELIKEAMGFK